MTDQPAEQAPQDRTRVVLSAREHADLLHRLAQLRTAAAAARNQLRDAEDGDLEALEILEHALADSPPHRPVGTTREILEREGVVDPTPRTADEVRDLAEQAAHLRDSLTRQVSDLSAALGEQMRANVDLQRRLDEAQAEIIRLRTLAAEESSGSTPA